MYPSPRVRRGAATARCCSSWTSPLSAQSTSALRLTASLAALSATAHQAHHPPLPLPLRALLYELYLCVHRHHSVGLHPALRQRLHPNGGDTFGGSCGRTRWGR